MADHQHAADHPVYGPVDLADRQRMFDNFVKFWVYHAVAVAVILIFLALVA